MKNATDALAASIDLLQDQIMLNGEINLLLIESKEIMSRAIWLQKKNFEWDPRDPHTEVFSDITRKNVGESVHGLNPDEYEEMCMVMTGLSTVVTKYAPPFCRSRVCEGAIVTKTIINPNPKLAYIFHHRTVRRQDTDCKPFL